MAIRKGEKAVGKIHSPDGKAHNNEPTNKEAAPLRASNKSTSHSGNQSKRGSQSWDTQKWLIGKKLAHVVKKKLIAEFRTENSAGSGETTRRERSMPGAKRIEKSKAGKQKARP